MRRGAEEGQAETEAGVLHLIGGEAMRKRGPGRPKGSKNATDAEVAIIPARRGGRRRCLDCGQVRIDKEYV